VARVVVIEDEEPIAAAVAARLRSEGFEVEVAADGPSGVALVERTRPDLVVLDLMLPGFDGLEVCRRIQKDRPVPVLMLTARDSETDLLVGLAVGADDYLTKPFSPQELVLRVGAILRRLRATPTASDVLQVGVVQIDRAAHRVTIDGQEVELTPTEFKLLLTLAERRGRVQARGHLLETVWEAAPDIQTRTVDMHIQRLRAKLGPAGELIETVRGFGYRLRVPQTKSA
jgi:two-component system phosphate regulon response regulator PhoB